MVVARVFGGLGNQFFIYAAARSLALQLNTELYLDSRSGFKNDTYNRQFELDKFNIVSKDAGYIQSFQFPLGRYFQAAFRRNKFLNSIIPFTYIYETNIINYQQSYFDVKPGKDIYLEGYWQSPEYFKKYRNIITKELCLKVELSDASNEIEKRILNELNAVCLHARRMYQAAGVEDAKVDADDYERCIPAKYYKACVQNIIECKPDAHFFCFGDYPEWFQDNIDFNTDQFTIVNHNKYHMNLGYEDFHLMSLCKHFVISNSTFSWWAAYVGEKDNSKIYSPQKSYWGNKDILPEGWLIY